MSRVVLVGESKKPDPAPEALLRRHAGRTPTFPALVDPPNRAALGFGRARLLNYGHADAIVSRLARMLVDLGLKPGDLLGLQIPNFIEQPLLMLAAWRAGLSVTLYPLAWRGAELRAVFETAPPHAIVAAGRFGDFDYAELMREVAAEHVSVRHVLGLGDHIPDGVTSFAEHLTPGDSFEPSEKFGRRPADQPAFIGWSVTAKDGAIPVPWFDDELTALGRATAELLGLGRKEVTLSAYPMGSLVGLGLGLMPWLVTGSVLLQHHPFDYAVFLAQLRQSRVTGAAVPVALLRALAADKVLDDGSTRLGRLACVWPALSPDGPAREPLDPAVPVIDLHNLAELALAIRRRDSSADPRLIPLGKSLNGGVETRVRGTVSNGDEPPVLRGDLYVRGDPTPKRTGDPFAADVQSFLNTRIRCKVVADARGIVREPDGELIRLGGITLSAPALDELYAGYADFLDVAAFALPDPVLGQRLFAAAIPRPGVSISRDGLAEHLTRHGAAPCTVPEKIVVVRQIPRDAATGRVQRDEILATV